MLVKAHAAAMHLQHLDPAVRLYVFGGPDDAAAGALRDQVVAAVGPDAERVDVALGTIESTPSILADEAASISLFGGQRWISVSASSGSGDELMPAVENLMAVPVAGCPVVVTVNGLTARSKLVKLAERDDRIIASICYPATARELGPMVAAMARPLGLSLDAEVVRALGQATANDRGLIASELEKLAIYCDADPAMPHSVTMEDWRAIGAAVDDADLTPAINAAFGGRLSVLPQLLADLTIQDRLDIRLIRAMMARAHLIARLRLAVDGGQSLDVAMTAQGSAIFWKEKDAIKQQAGRWSASRIARAIERLHALERQLKAPESAGALLVRDVMLGFARAAAQEGRARA